MRLTAGAAGIALLLAAACAHGADAPAERLQRGHRYAVVVGIANYRESENNLAAAADDARAMAKFLGETSRSGGYAVTLLTDAQATRQAILGALTSVAERSGPNDTVMFFYSGHSFQDPEGRIFLFPHDGSRRELTDTSIALSRVTERFRGLVARQRFLILDSCHSGGAGGELMASKGASGPALPDETFAKLDGGEGMMVLASSQASEFSYEDTGEGGSGLGYFTKHLLAGLRGSADGDWGPESTGKADGIVTAEELYEYVYYKANAELKTKRGFTQRARRKIDAQGTLVMALVPKDAATPSPSASPPLPVATPPAPPPSPAEDAPPKLARPAPGGGEDLLAQRHGGRCVVATAKRWGELNDGREAAVEGFTREEEGVFVFRDERFATFDTLEVFVPTMREYAKTLELLASDESPFGPFRSIGTFDVDPAPPAGGPYQAFRFEPTRARYVKVKLLDGHNPQWYHGTWMCELRLRGQLEPGGAPAARALAPPPPAGRNILSKMRGGQVMMAPSEAWWKTIDGQEEWENGFYKDHEAVFAFRDEQPATLDAFGIFIPGSSECVKTFELSIGDEGPTGAFRLIGTFDTENVRLMDNPYQIFRFEPVTGRYLKFKILDGHRAQWYHGTSIWELQAYGTVKPAPGPRSAAASPRPRTNLLDATRGGHVLAPAPDRWKALIDGRDSFQNYFEKGEEAVFAFQDERPAEFDTFAVLIAARAECASRLELSAADAPAGPFRVIGTFDTVNARMRDPYQAFTFPPQTARYVKVKVVDGHAPQWWHGTGMWELRLLGTLK